MATKGSILCDQCGHRSKVTNSRPVDGSVVRRRECFKCGHRWTTIEVKEHVYLPGQKWPPEVIAAVEALHTMAVEGRDAVEALLAKVKGAKGKA